MISNILGFSCVENLFLYFLQPRCENLGLLYFDSFMPLNQIYECAKRGSFEYFSGIPRIHNVLKNNSLLEIELYTDDFENFLGHIEKIDNDSQILMLMNAKNTQRIFCARGLREDHYIDVSENDQKYILTNDIPHNSIETNRNELENVYMNNFLELSYKPFYSNDVLLHLEKQRKYPLTSSTTNISIAEIESVDFLQVFRNTLVILKTMRERLSVYMNARGYALDISDEITTITRITSQTEYMRLRKVLGKEKYANLIDKINEIDRRIFNKVRGV